MADDGNGRVTMAVIGAKLDQVIATLERACREQEEARGRIIVLEERLAARISHTDSVHTAMRSEIDGISKDVDRLGARDLFGSIGVSLLALGAGVIGWLKP